MEALREGRLYEDFWEGLDQMELYPPSKKQLKAHDATVRKELEKQATGSNANWPRVLSQRAICYASLIYQWATHDVEMPLAWVEDKIASVNGSQTGGTAEILGFGGRQYCGVVDARPGWAVIRAQRKRGLHWKHVYVVFRGSRGDPPQIKKKKGWKIGFRDTVEVTNKDNPMAAGWGTDDKGVLKNVDWRADLDTTQVAPQFTCSGHAKLQKGFQTLYMSMRRQIMQLVKQEVSDNPRTVVVVTGHSLGAALATLCAYDLSYEMVDHKNLCYISFCCPRAGNEHFAKDFNVRLANTNFVSVTDTGTFRRAFRFDQKNDPVSAGQKFAFKNPIAWDDKTPEKGMVAKGWKATVKTEDFGQAYYHVQNRINISVTGMHAYTDMMDDIFECGTFGNKVSKSNVAKNKPLFVYKG